MRLINFVWLTVWPLLSVSRAALAQTDDHGFVLVAAAETVSVERVHREAGRMVSDLVVKLGGGGRIKMVLTLGPDGMVSRMQIGTFRAADPDDARPLQTGDFSFAGDSVHGVIAAGDSSKPIRGAVTRGAIPYINPSFALVELALTRARAMTGPTVTVPLVSAQGLQPVPMVVTWVGADSATITFAGAEARLAVDAGGRLLGGSIPAQRITIVRTGALTDATMRADKPDYSAPRGAPYTAENVVIPTSRGYTLAGTLTLPSNARGPVPAVVTITGSGLEDRDEAIPPVKGYRPFRQVADTLARRGIATLRMDDRSFGGSGGDARTATSDDFAQDIESGLAYLRTRKDVDGARLGLVGHSEGGLIAPIIAARDPRLKAIVLMAGPAYTGRRVLDFQNRFALEHDTMLTAAKRDSLIRIVVPRSLDSLQRAMPWMGFFMTHDPVATARTVRQPVLVLQGATDQQVTAEQADTLANAFRVGGNHDVTVHVFPETNHLFLHDPSGNPAGYTALRETAIKPEILGAIADWLAGKMK